MEQAGAADAVRAVVDYCTERYGPLSFSAGGSLKLIQSRVAGGGYAAGGASLLDEMDFTAANLARRRQGGRPRRGDDPRAGPPVVGPGQHV